MGQEMRGRAAGVVLFVALAVCAPLAAAPRGDSRALRDARVDLPDFHGGARADFVAASLFSFLGARSADPLERLIDAADAAFRRGEQYYEAGHLEHARAEFDRAVDIYLTAPVRPREDPRLYFSFDSLVDRIHQLELAVRDTNGGAETSDVPAAIEEVAPLTFAPDPALRAQVEQELSALVRDLPEELNERVLNVINFFQTSRGRRILENGFRRAGRYREMITAILRDEGLPTDLLYLAQAESAFQPNARSRARAVGLWQFVSFRAQEYGLKINWWVDERRDPVKSTRAAARHLRDLYQQFGDWFLAMAAYNAGPGGVSRAMERASTSDYWELIERRKLPRETRNYVPIILAVTLIAKNPERYGVSVEPEPPLRFETVKVPKPTDLRRLAESAGVDVDVLRELNPHVLHNVTPPGDPDFELYVPVGTGEMLRAALPSLPEASTVLWPRHRVRRGETLSRLGARYGTSATAIAEANGLSLRAHIHPGDVLVIPVGGVRGDSKRGSARGKTSTRASAESRSRPRSANAKGPVTHRVRSGETLWELSRRYGVSIALLRDANPFLDSRPLRAGDRLQIPR
jgi:membrane-bound lytic murein transglycosylase D